jgi:hypothetical protein
LPQTPAIAVPFRRFAGPIGAPAPRVLVDEHAAPIHGMIAAEGHRCTEATIEAAVAAAGPHCARLTVIAVAEPDHPIAVWAPLTGVVTLEELRRHATARACTAVRWALTGVPERLPVQHRVALAWRDALRMADGCDLLVVAAEPSRARDRRLLRRAWRNGTQIVVVGR